MLYSALLHFAFKIRDLGVAVSNNGNATVPCGLILHNEGTR